MSKATEQLAEKQNYYELSDKQKAVIDAFAENPDSTHRELFERANELLDGQGDSISRAYIPVIMEKYRHIANQQKDIKLNKRDEGDLEFENVIIDPGKEIEVNTNLNRQDVESIMNLRFTKSLRAKLLDSVLDQAFEDQ